MELKPIANFPKYYISSCGKVWSQNHKRFLNGSVTEWGYIKVALYRTRKRFFRFVHHLVLEMFISSRPEGAVCRHLDGNPQNNSCENLCWGTLKENAQDSLRHGTFIGKLSEIQKELINYLWKTGGFRQWELAAMFDVNQSDISYHVNKDKSKKQVELEKSVPA